MSDWDFRKESNETHAGDVGSVASFKAGMQPCHEADVKASKRNVIATDKGWVRRTIKNNGTDTASGVRIHDEVLVAAGDKTSAADLGFPNIAEIWLSANSSTAVKSGAVCNVYVTFNEPVKNSGGSGPWKMAAFSNTAGGKNDVVANGAFHATIIKRANSSNTGITVANNTLVFSFTPAGDGSDAGDYKLPIGATAIVNATSVGMNVVSLNAGFRAANDFITGAVANTLGTFTIAGV